MPCTAATTGTLAYLKHIDAFWNSPTYSSSRSNWPAAIAFGHFLEVGAEGERRLVPDDHALQLGFSARRDGFLHAEDHITTERVIAA
jgi:hypothetical protein